MMPNEHATRSGLEYEASGESPRSKRSRWGSRARIEVPIERVDVSAYVVPTDAPESDGTYEWNATTLVLVRVRGAGRCGLGYTYADTATAHLAADMLSELVCGHDAMAIPAVWEMMVGAVRNLGRPGIASMAISAVDAALWDLKARVLELPLVTLLGSVRDSVPVYGSGGFTSYTPAELGVRLSEWVTRGITRVKMKVGRDPHADVARVRAARDAIGERTELLSMQTAPTLARRRCVSPRRSRSMA